MIIKKTLSLWCAVLCAALMLSGCADKNAEETPVSKSKQIIVLDAGHGKPSSAMSAQEKQNEGYVYNEGRKNWGEWRHYKSNTFGENCLGSGCVRSGTCWYPMGNGDRDTEPEINLKNALAAKECLEQMGYEVRVTRNTNEENPSMDKRVSYCFPQNDITAQPDAQVYVCIHSNAGGGSGTSYVRLGGKYTQKYISDDYIQRSNELAERINKKVAEATSLSCNPPISGEEYLILFNKCPVPIAYLEIGFYDNKEDLQILNTSYSAVGQAIADGIDSFLKGEESSSNGKVNKN